MNIEINISSDVIENKEDVVKYFNEIFTDNFNKIIDGVDGDKISAKLGFDSDRKWNEFVKEYKDHLTTSLEKSLKLLTSETKIEEENPAETKGQNESVKTTADTFTSLLESYLTN